MTAVELQALLAAHDARPLKARGQHFLLDERVVEKMAEAAAVGPGDAVLEIGPGPGLLTAELLKRGAAVTAVELDRKMCRLLESRFSQQIKVGSLNVIQGDVLKIPNAQFQNSAPHTPNSKPKLVANLPYNITSAVMQKFLLEEPKPASLTIMIQQEVADRILARPGSMNSLAVLVQTLGEPRRILEVAPGAFLPPPRVRSAVIHIRLKTAAELKVFFGPVTPERYFSIVRTAFAHPRQQLKTSLKTLVRTKAFEDAQIDPKKRPENLSPTDWVELSRSAGFT